MPSKEKKIIRYEKKYYHIRNTCNTWDFTGEITSKQNLKEQKKLKLIIY